MTYEEAVAKLMLAMGYEAVWLKDEWREQGKEPLWIKNRGTKQAEAIKRIDANFVVEYIIPWAFSVGIEIKSRWTGSYWLCSWKTHTGDQECEGDSMHEAVIMAVAEALG